MAAGKNQPFSKNFDTKLIVLYLLLVFVGWLAIFSSNYDQTATNSLFDLSKNYGRQLIWIGTSFVLAIVLLSLDSKIYQTYAYVVYGICLFLMILVLFVGTEISGAKAWIKIGAFSIQPAEFAKFATALALAKFFNEGKTQSEKRHLWMLASAFVVVPIVIILLQHDTGSALVYVSFIFLFYREGMSGNILIIGATAIVITLLTLILNELYTLAILTTIFIIFWILHRKQKKKLIRNAIIFAVAVGFVFVVNLAYDNVLQPHQRQRVESLLGKTADPRGADFNLNQSKIAIGSGGFFGKGFLDGTQTKLDFVPEQSTDFIFCSIGEEFGFVGSAVILCLFAFLILRILKLAESHRNPFVRYYGYGVAGIIFFHVVINIGMTIGLMPIIGIPLPFLSYGGSSLWGFTILLFIFIRLNNS